MELHTRHLHTCNKTNQLLEQRALPQLDQPEADHFNGPVTVEDIAFVIKTFLRVSLRTQVPSLENPNKCFKKNPH